jgi:LysM repeat protein
MLDRILGPFIGYWYWAQDRETPLTKALALGAPLVVFGLILYLLFGRGGGDSALQLDVPGTQTNIAAGTTTSIPTTVATQIVTTGTQPATTGTQPAATGAQPEASATTAPASTAEAAPTAFTQERYTVVAGDTPDGIAEKVGVPEASRDSWIEEMLALNGVTATTLQIGQELILPPF